MTLRNISFPTIHRHKQMHLGKWPEKSSFSAGLTSPSDIDTDDMTDKTDTDKTNDSSHNSENDVTNDNVISGLSVTTTVDGVLAVTEQPSTSLVKSVYTNQLLSQTQDQKQLLKTFFKNSVMSGQVSYVHPSLVQPASPGCSCGRCGGLDVGWQQSAQGCLSSHSSSSSRQTCCAGSSGIN